MYNDSSLLAREAACSSQADNVFGPTIDGCHDGFDFTLLFEQSVLSILPAVVFLLASPLRVLYLFKQDRKTVSSYVKTSKTATATVLAASQLVVLVLWCLDRGLQTRASIPAAVLNFLVALEIVALSRLEHERSIKPSFLLNIYLIFSFVFDIVQIRTLFLHRSIGVIAGVFTAVVGSKVALLVLEAQDKRALLISAYQGLSLESTSGVINHSFLWWLNGLFVRGFQSLITDHDLYKLDNGLAGEPLGRKLQDSWNRRSRPEGRFSFVLAVLRTFRRPLLWAVIPRLFLIGFHFAQPFLITRTLDLLGEPETPLTMNEGYGLIAATGIIYGGIALSTLRYNHNLFRLLTMFRGAAVALIYDRTLTLRHGFYDESAAITVMSTDVDRITDCLEELNECWARLIEMSVGISLLARQLGWVAVVPLVVIGLTSGGMSLVAKSIGNRQKIWIDAVQKRIAITSSMLSEMRTIKMMGLSEKVQTMIQDQRVYETQRMAGFLWLNVWQNVVCNLPWAWAPAATFAVYAIQAKITGSDSLNTTQAFTSLAILTLTTDPTAKLLSSIPNTAASLGCFERIQEFLLAPPRQDQRIVDAAAEGSSLIGETGDIELQQLTSRRMQSKGDVTVNIKNTTIRPADTSAIALRNINLEARQGSTVIVAGPVGSGKSTLLRAVLGEITAEEGSVFVQTTRIAYCSQTPWLPNSSIQQTICSLDDNQAIDEMWYKTVIHACALEEDLSALSAGDQTIIGSRGVILSGGQKQRISLARAVYSRNSIVLLDDVLSALDKKTEKTIVDRLFGKQGLFKQLGATVILVTHATQYLPLADQIVLLSSNGKVAQQGSYDEVMTNGFVNSTLMKEIEHIENKTEDEEQKQQEKHTPGTSEAEAAAEVQDLTRQTGDLTVYKYYFKSVGWNKILVFTGFALLHQFSASFSQVWLMWWADVHGGQIALYVCIYILLSVGNSIGNGGYAWAMGVRISPSTGRKFHYKLLQTVMRAPQSLFDQTDTGSLLNRFSQDMTLIQGSLATAVLITITNFIGTMADVALISTGSTYMAITVPFFILCIYALQHVYLRTSRQLRFLDLEARSPVYSHFLETLEGLSTIRAFGWQQKARRLNLKRLDNSQRPYYLLYCIQRWLSLVLDLIIAVMGVIVVALALKLRATTSPGLLGISLNNILSFNISVSSFVTGWTMLETSLGAIARLRDFELITPVEAQPSETITPPSDWPSYGSVTFTNITASHTPTSLPAIQAISLAVSSAQKIGIVGRTGSGKSSLLAALLRIIEISAGNITIDGYDIATISRELLRSRIITMPQDPLSFHGTVRANADPFSRRTDEEIVAALDKVRLWLTIAERGGLDAELNMASTLSRGQQQLFALARALLQRPEAGRILVLDEATSSVDAETDRVMQGVIREEFSQTGYTVLCVAHRLETIMDSNLVVVLDGGMVAEVGGVEELLRREDGVFRRLHDGR